MTPEQALEEGYPDVLASVWAICEVHAQYSYEGAYNGEPMAWAELPEDVRKWFRKQAARTMWIEAAASQPKP